ncbi:glycoside hydrolase family 88/105 protein [Sphingobacterium pedocola]|uniref:Family 88 glycosyl hydrolase n=1 Tax=Sphingobacterium pedocola TaxID=2082722 RepID=A0ABR9T9D5_9SPHI|nr:glycoside hydrolase family 88 protein [Sphingobacterium pedocola]MBE8721965.1 family 88 glycosyl hydrolase [Sphingobacterium pedocola]
MTKRILTLLMLVVVTGMTFAQRTDKKVFSKKYIKNIMLKATDWQLKHPKHDPKDWTNGALYAGVVATWQTTGSKKVYNAMRDIASTQDWMPFKRWYHADDIVVNQTYLDLYQEERKPEMIQPTIEVVDKLLANPYPTKGEVDVIKWWWCDALFMGPPTLVKLAMITGEKKYLDASDEYFEESYDLLYNKEERLFARDLNYVIKPDGSGRKEANGKKIFWSRGNGWVMGGLVRILKELPQDYPKRAFYEGLFMEMASRIRELQQADGLWRASLLDPASYPGGEVSGSGFFCYALAWGINNNLLDKKEFLPIVEKAWVALTTCVNEEGRVGWVQPIGATPQKNFSENSWEVYGTGAFLLAGSEVIKLKR